MDFAIGIILLISFIAFAVYAYRGKNLMIGFVAMSLLWTLLPVGFSLVQSPQDSAPLLDALHRVFQTAPEKWGGVLVNIFFGAFFGQVLLETGIAKEVITRSIELSGDNPVIVLSIVNLITCLIFSSMSGAGAVISIAIIVIPILLSIGIPKDIALFSFTGSVAAGIFANPVNFTQYQAFFSDPNYRFLDYAPFGYLSAVIMLLIVSFSSAIYLRLRGNRKMWAISYYDRDETMPRLALITPLIPVIGVAILKLPTIVCFIIASVFAVLVCDLFEKKKMSTSQVVSKLFADGVKDTASMVGFWMALSMFNASAQFAGPYFNVVLGNVIPHSPFALTLFFAFFSIFTWFRGPMSLIGCGAAVLEVIQQSPMAYPTSFLYRLFIVIMIGMGHFDVTTSWIAWGLSYTKLDAKDYMRLALVPGLVIAFVLEMLTYIFFGGF